MLPDLAAALAGVTSTAIAGGYLGTQVLPELLDVLKGDWPYRAAAMTVVDGAMDAVELVLRARVRHGDRVLVADPTFPPFLDLTPLRGLLREFSEPARSGYRIAPGRYPAACGFAFTTAATRSSTAATCRPAIPVKDAGSATSAPS